MLDKISWEDGWPTVEALRCIHGSGETEILTSMKKSILISLLALLMMGCQVSGGSSLKVEETTVEMRKNPEASGCIGSPFLMATGNRQAGCDADCLSD